MDRQLVYPGQIPLETDLLSTNKNAMLALGLLAQDLLGSSTVASGLACTQTVSPSLAVLVAPGRLYSMQNIDSTAYSSIAADTTHQIIKQGILLDAATLACPAPVTAGFSVNYLIEAAYQDSDSVSVTLPYYNASNPTQAYSGPGNSGASQATVRKGVISLQAKVGIAAATGTQMTPAVDSGYVGLWVVTVANGQATITNSNISLAPGAPFLTNTLSGIGTRLADGATPGNGTGMLGWLRAATSAVATTLQAWLGWREINAFEFMTVAQIADYQSAAATLDLAVPLQAWINACAASATSGGKLIGRLPPGGGRVGTTLTVPGSVVLRGHGVNSQLKGWGVPVFQVTGDHVVIEDMGLFAYTNAGVADPRAQSAITTNGTLGAANNYGRFKRLYLQGWNRAIDFSYMWGSVVDDVTTVNCNYGIRYFGQCVNNAVNNSRLVVNGGTTSIQTVKDVANQGEGLVVTNCLLASGANACTSDGFLLLSFYNCICDLLTGYAFDVNGVTNLVIDCPWVYSAQRCVNFQAQGAAFNADAYIKIGLAQTTGAAQACIVVGSNNNGIVIAGGTYVLTNAGASLPLVLGGNNIVVGPIICRNATSNSDVQINGNNIRISQEALLLNGIQTSVSQIRSVASGATTTLPYPTGAVLERITVTGSTNCATLNDPTGWFGKVIVLMFTGTPTWTNGANLKLNGNYTAAANGSLTLCSDGVNWTEIARR
jgi:hypothetical protein